MPICPVSLATSQINSKGRKFDQVLEGARKVFMADGFERANVDQIAQTAGVSKATLYSYFPDKEQLFAEVARLECLRMADAAAAEINTQGPIGEVLTSLAMRLAKYLLSDFTQTMFRICVSERDRFPDIARAFYDCGPEMGRKRLEEVLAHGVARGELKIDNLTLAAEQFSDLSKSYLWMRAVFGIQTEFSQDEIATVTNEAVATFMARYGT
ncbi:TetR/AcrR family transcriptional regulator [Rhodobacteraceae bacterium D3-12]|nr:TetR/AcrR family transcriptional regulator [Rhodobacteraceae bacterium D3-12]